MSTGSLLTNNHKAAVNGKECVWPLLLLATHNSNDGARRAPMAEPKQQRTSRTELLARPQCLKATGDLRCLHRHAVLLVFNVRNPAFTAVARCQRDWRNLPIAHAALSSPKIRLGKRGRDKQFARYGSMDGGNRSSLI